MSEKRAKKIKILRIISRLNIGGPAIHTIVLSHELDKMGYQTVLVKGSEGIKEGNMMTLAKEKNVNPILISELKREIDLKNDLKAFYKIYKLIKSERPDIVHTHTAKAGAIGRIAAWLARVPVIIHTFHGHVLEGYFGRLKTWIFIIIERILARLTDSIITLSEGLKNELVHMKIASFKKISVIPLGLELDRFINPDIRKNTFKISLGISENTLLVGIVGRLVPIKGHRVFLEAVRKIMGLRLDISDLQPVKFIVIGDGELRSELEKYTDELGIREHVIFTGFRSDLPDIYADTDIIVLSSYNEGTPVSLIEAMTAGVPIVATKVGGVSDLIHDNVTGLLVPAGDADALAAGIIRLLDDHALRKQMGANAQKTVYPKYDVSNLVKNMDELYNILLKKKKIA